MEFVELVVRIEKSEDGKITIKPCIKDASYEVSPGLLNTKITIESIEKLYKAWKEDPGECARKTVRKISDVIRIPGVFEDSLNFEGTEEQYRLPGVTISVYFESIELEFDNEDFYRRAVEEWRKSSLTGLALDDGRKIVINIDALPSGGCIEYGLGELRRVEKFLEKIEEISMDYI